MSKLSEEEIIDKINYMINNWHRSVVEINIEWIKRIIRPIPKGKREKYGIRTRKHRTKGRKKISSRRDTRTILCEQR